jgi:hypothetical protein
VTATQCRRQVDNAAALAAAEGGTKSPTRLRGDVFGNEQTLAAPNWQIVAKDKPMKPVTCLFCAPRWMST